MALNEHLRSMRKRNRSVICMCWARQNSKLGRFMLSNCMWLPYIVSGNVAHPFYVMYGPGVSVACDSGAGMIRNDVGCRNLPSCATRNALYQQTFGFTRQPCLNMFVPCTPLVPRGRKAALCLFGHFQTTCGHRESASRHCPHFHTCIPIHIPADSISYTVAGSHTHTYRFTRFSAAPHATILLLRTTHSCACSTSVLSCLDERTACIYIISSDVCAFS